MGKKAIVLTYNRMHKMLQIIDITKNFGTKSAVEKVSLAFDGGFIAITGRSGSGKSTLLKMAGLLLKPTAGQILLDGKDVWQVTERERNAYRNSRLGFVFQDYSLEPYYTVAENIELPLLIGGMKRAERKARVEECLAFIGMEQMQKQRAGTLSGGEKQRVAVARAIANRPAFLLADEPCGNLDKDNGDNIMRLFRSLSEEGVTVIMVTHNEEDLKKTDRIIRLLDGRVISDERL